MNEEYPHQSNQENQTPTPLLRLRCKELEDIFIKRFEENFAKFRTYGRLFHTNEGKIYPANASLKTPKRSHKQMRLLQKMKELKIFDRSILEEMPSQKQSQFQIYSKNFWGKKIPKIIVAAISIFPIEPLLLSQNPPKMNSTAAEEAIKSIVKETNLYYYIGIASLTGWEEETLTQLSPGPNWQIALIENLNSTCWKTQFHDKESWNGLDKVYDPETEAEKILRCKNYLKHHSDLKRKGGHVLLNHLSEKLNLPDAIIVQAIEEILETDPQLELQEIAGRRILKRKRI